MPQYIRALVPGGTFFFTVALLERRRQLLTENIDNLREVFQAAQRWRSFTAGLNAKHGERVSVLWFLVLIRGSLAHTNFCLHRGSIFECKGEGARPVLL
jgi:hypothetical protein